MSGIGDRLLPCGLFFLVAALLPSRAEILINELDSDQVGTDTGEFVELYNPDDAAVDLAAGRYVLVFFNGNAADDDSYRAIDLSGTIPPRGFFVIGAATVPNVHLVPATWPASNAIQNGADAVALYRAKSGADFPNGTPPTTANLVDALVHDNGVGDDLALIALLTPGEPQISEGSDGLDSIQRLPDGCGGVRVTRAYVRGPRTPGLPNASPNSPSLVCTPRGPNSAFDWTSYE